MRQGKRPSIWRWVPHFSITLLIIYVSVTFYFLSQVSNGSIKIAEQKGLLRLENVSPSVWTVDDVGLWLMVSGFPQYRQSFQDAFVNGQKLLSADLQELEERLRVHSFLDAHRILKLIDKLKKGGKFQADGLGVHEVGVYATGDNFSSLPRHKLMSHSQANLDELLKLTSELMGRRIVKILREDGLEVQNGEKIPDKIIALQEGQYFVFPIETVGFTREVQIPEENKTLTVETLSDSPRVFRIRNFITPQECDQIIEWSADRMGPSTVAQQGKAHENKVDNQIRTSSTTWVPPNWPIAPQIRSRVATLTKLPMENAEDMQVLRYERSQHYWAHHDYFDPKLYPDPIYQTTNRFVTVLFYLSEGFTGGETVFPFARGGDPSKGMANYASCDLGIRVPPEKGTAVMFYSLTAPGHQNAELDPASLHGSCDVTSDNGTKWAANYWIRNKRWWR